MALLYDLTCGMYGIIVWPYLWYVWRYCVILLLVCVELFSHLTCDICHITCCGMYGIIVW